MLLLSNYSVVILCLVSYEWAHANLEYVMCRSLHHFDRVLLYLVCNRWATASSHPVRPWSCSGLDHLQLTYGILGFPLAGVLSASLGSGAKKMQMRTTMRPLLWESHKMWYQAPREPLLPWLVRILGVSLSSVSSQPKTNFMFVYPRFWNWIWSDPKPVLLIEKLICWTTQHTQNSVVPVLLVDYEKVFEHTSLIGTAIWIKASAKCIHVNI